MDVIIFYTPPIRQQGVIYPKDGDQIRGGIEKWFVFIRAERGERLKPFLRCASVIELPLLLFGRHTDFMFYFGIADYNKVPGLKIGSVGRNPGGEQALFDNLTRHGFVGEMPDGAAALHFFTKRGGSFPHFIIRVFGKVQWLELSGGYGVS
jgi:hypothetical protein